MELRPEQTALIDEEVDELTEDQEEGARERTKSRWAALECLVGTESRIQKIAGDLVTHYETRNSAMVGKAIIVCMSRDVCVQLYNAIVALRPDWHDADSSAGSIKIVMTGSASDKADLRPHVYSGKVKKKLEKRFQEPSRPLPPSDRPRHVADGLSCALHDKDVRRQAHEGTQPDQAIARVNRVFRDKPGGLVVDYIGIANELKGALKEYTQSRGNGRPTVPAEEAYRTLQEHLRSLEGCCTGSITANSEQRLRSYFAGLQTTSSAWKTERGDMPTAFSPPQRQLPSAARWIRLLLNETSSHFCKD